MAWLVAVMPAFVVALAGIVYIGGRDEQRRRRLAEAWFVAKREAPTVTIEQLPGFASDGSEGRPVAMEGRLTGTARESPLSGGAGPALRARRDPPGFPWREPSWQDVFTSPDLALETEGGSVALHGALQVARSTFLSRRDHEAARALVRAKGLSPADHFVSGVVLEVGARVRVVGLVEPDPDRTALRADGYRGGWPGPTASSATSAPAGPSR
jgi:hypothetical protein